MADHLDGLDRLLVGIEEARHRLARHMIATDLEEFVRLRDAAARATADRRAKEEEVRRLDAEIARLEREIVEHRHLAEDLNEDLQKYLGHECDHVERSARRGCIAGRMPRGICPWAARRILEALLATRSR